MLSERLRKAVVDVSVHVRELERIAAGLMVVTATPFDATGGAP